MFKHTHKHAHAQAHTMKDAQISVRYIQIPSHKLLEKTAFTIDNLYFYLMENAMSGFWFLLWHSCHWSEMSHILGINKGFLVFA